MSPVADFTEQVIDDDLLMPGTLSRSGLESLHLSTGQGGRVLDLAAEYGLSVVAATRTLAVVGLGAERVTLVDRYWPASAVCAALARILDEWDADLRASGQSPRGLPPAATAADSLEALLTGATGAANAAAVTSGIASQLARVLLDRFENSSFGDPGVFFGRAPQVDGHVEVASVLLTSSLQEAVGTSDLWIGKVPTVQISRLVAIAVDDATLLHRARILQGDPRTITLVPPPTHHAPAGRTFPDR